MGRINYFLNRQKAAKMDVESYLKRIGEKKEAPSLAYLRRLHRTHLIHIPFENLDIHYGKKIILDYDKIFKKVIHGKRGGYCYEVNGLFFHLLYHLGFEAKIISARVRNEKTGDYGKDFDHMAIIVHLEGDDYLVDVGFGKGIIYPKKIADGLTQMDYTDYWRLSKDVDNNYFLQSSDDARVFTAKYTFSIDPKELIQFFEMNEYQQHDPNASFLQEKIITKLTETGRITLSDKKFVELHLGISRQTELTNEDEFLSLLEQHFGITLRQLIHG